MANGSIPQPFWSQFCIFRLEPDSAEVVVDLDDSKEKSSTEDLTDAVVTEDDDDSEEVKSDVNDSAENDSQEGINNVWQNCVNFRN